MTLTRYLLGRYPYRSLNAQGNNRRRNEWRHSRDRHRRRACKPSTGLRGCGWRCRSAVPETHQGRDRRLPDQPVRLRTVIKCQTGLHRIWTQGIYGHFHRGFPPFSSTCYRDSCCEAREIRGNASIPKHGNGAKSIRYQIAQGLVELRDLCTIRELQTWLFYFKLDTFGRRFSMLMC
jgi:hypothetical protein